MTGVAAEQDLYRACRIIFGPDLAVSREFLEYMQLSGVKSAFRKKALETHPDRLAGSGGAAGKRGALLFHTVKDAYEQLSRYLDAREKGYRFHGLRPRSAASPDFAAVNRVRRSSSSPGAHQRRSFFQGAVPARKLLFGQYLYYSACITWQELNQALCWQRSQRPRLGEIARNRGWLGREEILLVLRSATRSSLPFGQRALRQGLLTPVQLRLLLFEQKRLHRRLGEFFVATGVMSREQLRCALARFYRHNARFVQARPSNSRP